MSRIQSENYIVIQGWMLTELNLKGNELMIYAIIYGFSQNGDGQRYTGSLQYLADWTNSTKQGVIKNLKSLIDKGLIGKEERVFNNVKFCEYYSTKFNTPLNKVEYPIKQSLTGGIKQSLPNNIDIDNIDYIIEDSVGDKAPAAAPPEKPKEVKHKRGEYGHVLLTEDQEDKLMREYGEILTAKAIVFLDEYIEMKGYKAKNHYLAIRKWVISAVKEREAKNPQPVKIGFDLDEFFEAATLRGEESATVANDSKLRDRADKLKERLAN